MTSPTFEEAFSDSEADPESHPGINLIKSFRDIFGHLNGLIEEQDSLLRAMHHDNIALRQRCGDPIYCSHLHAGHVWNIQNKKLDEDLSSLAATLPVQNTDSTRCVQASPRNICTVCDADSAIPVSLDGPVLFFNGQENLVRDLQFDWHARSEQDHKLSRISKNKKTKRNFDQQGSETSDQAPKVSDVVSPQTSGGRTPRLNRYSTQHTRALNGDFKMRSEWEGQAEQFHESKITCSRTSALFAAIDRTATRVEVKIPDKPVKGLERLVLYPASNIRLYWDVLSMAFLAWDAVTIPFVLSFDPPTSDTLTVATWATLVFWTFDIVLSFFTGYQDGKTIVMKPRKIAKDYLRWRFWLDLTIVGIDWILSLGEQATKGSAARLGRSLRVLKLLKTLKLLRTLKLKKYIQVVQDQITTESVSIWFGIANVVVLLLVVNHIVACSWYAIGVIDYRSQTGWVEKLHMKDYPMSYSYATALHWSLSQFTPAPNEIFPGTIYERIFAVAVLVTAMVSFSGFVSTITAGVVQLKNISNAESKQFWQLRRYLRDWDVAQDCRQRIVRYLEFAWQRQRGRVQEQDVKLLSLLSDQLRIELKQQTLKGHLGMHALFNGLNNQARIFNRALGSKSLASGDIVFACAEQGVEMVFCGSGVLEYILGELEGGMSTKGMPLNRSRDLNDPETSGRFVEYDENGNFFEEKELVLIGQWVCEAVLWTADWMHLGDLQAQNECQIITIHGSQFAQAVRMNRLLWCDMRKYTQEFLKALNSTPQHELSDLMQDVCDPYVLMEDKSFKMNSFGGGNDGLNSSYLKELSRRVFTKKESEKAER